MIFCLFCVARIKKPLHEVKDKKWDHFIRVLRPLQKLCYGYYIIDRRHVIKLPLHQSVTRSYESSDRGPTLPSTSRHLHRMKLLM